MFKSFRKTNISYSHIGTRSCAYQEVRNVGFRKILSTYKKNDPLQCFKKVLHNFFFEVLQKSVKKFEAQPFPYKKTGATVLFIVLGTCLRSAQQIPLKTH